MLLRIYTHSAEPIYRQLVRQVHEAVAFGRLKIGDQLPSLREVARTLAINHLTVKQAYGILEQEGLIKSQRGRGTFVCSNGDRRLRKELEAHLKSRMRELVTAARLAGHTREQFQKLTQKIWQELGDKK